MSDDNPGRSNNNNNGSGNSNNSSSSSSNKRPRLLSFQGPSESATVERGRAPMAAGPSSSSLEEINSRHSAALATDLASWQEAQIAACIEDNTINMVLEQYLSFFEARHHHHQQHQAAADRNGVVEEREVLPLERELEVQAEIDHDQEVLVEDRAIMAAISEQGLQPAAAAAVGSVAFEDGANGSVALAGLIPMAGDRRIDDSLAASASETATVGAAVSPNHVGIDFLETAVVAAIQEKGLTSTGNQFYHGQMEEDDGS